MAVGVQNRPATAGIETKMVGPNRTRLVESNMDLRGRLAIAGPVTPLVTVADFQCDSPELG
jgi:hypothetical protein